jgi:hypothetical protein
MQQVQTYLSDTAPKVRLLGHEQINIRLPAQGSLELLRFAECGRAAVRHSRSLLLVRPDQTETVSAGRRNRAMHFRLIIRILQPSRRSVSP